LLRKRGRQRALWRLRARAPLPARVGVEVATVLHRLFFFFFFFFFVVCRSCVCVNLSFTSFARGVHRSLSLSAPSPLRELRLPCFARLHKMEEEPIIVPHAQGEARRRPNEGGGGGGRGDGDDAGSNGSSEEGVLVSPSSSPEPELAAASSPPPSYPLRGSVVAGQGLYMIDTHAARDLTPELLKEARRE